jgi:hypothetical protein
MQRIFGADPTKTFDVMSKYSGQKGNLTLSLDVIYHLVEDDILEHYMRTLFDASVRYVIIYSSDSNNNRGFEGTRVRHRKFSRWIQEHLPNLEATIKPISVQRGLQKGFSC